MTFASATIQERIRTARILRGLSQGGFSGVLGTHQSTVCRWESGKVAPQPASILEIAAALKVNMLWLAFGEGPMDASPPTTKDPLAGESFDSSNSAR